MAEQPPEPRQPHAVHHRRKPASCRSRPRPTTGFQNAKSRFSSLPPAKSMADAREGRRAEPRRGIYVGRNGRRGRAHAIVAIPNRAGGPACSRSSYQITGGSRINNSMKYVPENAYGDFRGQTVLTHGVEIGVARASSRDLGEATDTLIQSFLQGNPGMRVAGNSTTVRLSGRTGTGDAPHRAVGARGRRARRPVHHVARRRKPVLLRHRRSGPRGSALRPDV